MGGSVSEDANPARIAGAADGEGRLRRWRRAEPWAFGVVATYMLSPWRSVELDIAVMVAAALALRMAPAGLLPEPPTPRHPRSALALLGLGTALAAAVVVVWSAARGSPPRPRTVALVALAYLPFAALQQLLLQRYLLVRARAVSEAGAGPLAAGGFALLHLPFAELVAPVFAGALLWTWCYERAPRLIAVAASHALLGTLWFVGMLGTDPFAGVFQE